MIKYNGKNTMQTRAAPIPHPTAFIPRFFASV
jgi:hypothetical protein